MTKEEIKEVVAKRPDEVTREQLSDIFGIFCFQIKEYNVSKSDLSFEIHFRTNFIIRVDYPLNIGLMSFYNEFVNFSEGCHGISMSRAEDIGELFKLVINMFHSTLLARAGYQVYYQEEFSPYSSPEEMEEHFKYLQKLLA